MERHRERGGRVEEALVDGAGDASQAEGDGAEASGTKTPAVRRKVPAVVRRKVSSSAFQTERGTPAGARSTVKRRPPSCEARSTPGSETA
ncbi:MAG: hypothetical protein IPN17_34150 [Deltaproteobacteria bacterium]|nr:hypothetical protein [Deltaproteobacteria bacterium]